jgi:hypothetical protein
LRLEARGDRPGGWPYFPMRAAAETHVIAGEHSV